MEKLFRRDAETSTRDAWAPQHPTSPIHIDIRRKHRCAIEALDLRVCGFDDVIFVRRMRAAAVTKSEMSGSKCRLSL
jgi:hypothetical protein